MASASATPDIDMRILSKRDDLAAFRAAIRAWLAEVVPPNAMQRMISASEDEGVQIQRAWMAERNKVGLGTPHWPAGYGGVDLSLTHQVILSDELARASAPVNPVFLIALNHVPATLLAWGTEAQKRRYLPGVAAGDIWCQGFSEPGSGSDLASLRTRAEKRGDHYVINGQKIWSSMAHYAQYCILLARTSTDGAKQAGISFFLMDMKTPGIELRPIRQVNGRSEFNETFLTDVVIPAENLVGPENEGWRVAQATLASERGIVAFEYAERARHAMEAYYAQAVRDGAAWLDDPQLQREFIDLILELQANRRLIIKLLNESGLHHQQGDMLPAYIKLHGSAFRQRMASLMTKIAALQGQAFSLGFEDVYHPAMFTYLSAFAWTIAGGSSEIMRNMIAERALEMPRG
jgi:alkylation response protein AidB-like acyl-CoA dehydrogenase